MGSKIGFYILRMGRINLLAKKFKIQKKEVIQLAINHP